MGQYTRAEILADKNRRRILALSVGLFLFTIYFFCYRGGFHSIDEVSIFAVTESLVKFGRLNTDQIAWTQWTTTQAEAQGFFGRAGHVYSKKGLGLSLAQAPLYWLALNLAGLGMLQTVSILNSFITAATAVLLFMVLSRFNFSIATSLGAVLVYGLATIAVIYAKYLFSEPLAGFSLLLAGYMLFAYKQEGGLRHVAIAGLAAGLAVLTRANNLFLLPIFALYLLWISNGRIKTSLSTSSGPSFTSSLTRSFAYSIILPLAVFVLTISIAGVILFIYNALRSGNPLQTGYDLTLFTPDVILGLYKLLLSPLRGLFVYSPILLLSLPGWWLLYKIHTAEALLFAGLIGVTVGLFSMWSSGEGLSWGSRFLVPIIPFLAINLAPLMEQISTSQVANNTEYAGRNIPSASSLKLHAIRSPAGRSLPVGLHTGTKVLFYALLFISLAIQILGIAINPWVFLSQLQAEFGGEFFLENTTALYNFRYSQPVGQLQSWSLANSDVAWWQPWGFDGLAFGLSLLLILLSGLILWRLWQTPSTASSSVSVEQSNEFKTPLLSFYNPFFLIAATMITVSVTYFLLARYFITDQQFGPPDDGYTQALNTVVTKASSGDLIITVAQNHYHVPMNRFKARLPIVGFAQQAWPPPESALTLLEASSDQNNWLITVGYQPAAQDNAIERWLALNAFKASDEWFPNEMRLSRYGTEPPTITRPINVTFAQEVRLLEVKLAELLHPGQLLPVELAWLPLDQPRLDYNLFLQLLTAEGTLVVQHDGPPNGGYTPTSAWQAGQQVLDRHALVLPVDLQPDNYRLIVGLYDPDTAERLTVADDGDFVELGTITVESYP